MKQTKAKLEAMLTSARQHVEAGSVRAAEVYYRMIAKDTTNPATGTERVCHGEACMFFARKELHEGKIGTALDWYQRATYADPLAVEYRLEYVVRALLPMSMFKNAKIEAERATRIDPKSKQAWRTLAGIEMALGDADAATKAYDVQLALDPDDPNARIDRSVVALDTADYATVRKMCEPVLKTDRIADATQVLAMAMAREGNHEEAITLYDRAIELDCYEPNLTRWNKSISLHSIGRYKEGWAEHEARGKQGVDGGMRLIMNRFQRPMWDGAETQRPDGSPLRVHVHQEMGHGDTIAMARYLPAIRDRGIDVRFEVADSMVDLMRRSLPGVKVMPKAIDYPSAMGIPEFDAHVPMLSLPAIFATRVETIPWEGPYLQPDPVLQKKYRSMLPKNRRLIGICWSSGIRTEGIWLSTYGKMKSTRLAQWAPLLESSDCSDCVFVSLQVGPEREELRDAHVIDRLSQHPTWDDTAALASCLDAVITVDTGVSHLVGALGIPTHLAMHRNGSWHYMCERPGAPWNDRSPWYPETEVHRQSSDWQWADVVEKIRVALRVAGRNVA